MLDYKLLGQTPRVLLQAGLRPMQGERFQPTGFADIGAAEYTKPDRDGTKGTPMLLVESAQSVANRLERTCLDGDGPEIDPELAGLPYVMATLDGKGMGAIRTSSLVEPHRLASPYVLWPTFGEQLAAEMGYSGKGALNWKKIYAVLFRYDPNCLIHGVFLSLIGDGRIRVPRAISGFIEAENVRQAVSGGVKNSPVDPTGEIQVDGGKQKSGLYSNVPYSRIEYVAEKIIAYFNLDTIQIRSYGLGESATHLIIALSLLKVRRFLTSDLRLRTACNLALCEGVPSASPRDFVLPSEAELLNEVKRLISVCGSQFANPAVTELKVPVVKKKAKGDDSKPASPEELPEGSTDDNG